MRCNRHLTDLSSGVGVCATCLRERLLSVIAAQTRLELAAAAAVAEDRRKHEQPSLIFPRSVSPYVNRRKSDDDGATWIRHQRFYSTPQVGSSSTTITAYFDAASAAFKKKHKFSLFSNLFGTRSEKFSSGPSVHNHRESCDETSSSSSTSWFSAIFTAGRKNQQFCRTSRIEHFTQFGHRDRRSCGVDRGMSPAIEVNPGDECDRSPPRSSPEVSPRRKRTPTRASRGRTGARNKSGMAFCLSPLVRASPNRQWNQRSGLAPDMTHTSEGRPPMKPHLGSAARFCANRSKKIADFGRVNHNR